MKFFRTTVLASFSTATTMLCGLITTKYVAVFIGPSGMALTGQFFNVSAIVTLLASAAITTGIIKLLAENKEEQQRKKIVQTVYAITGLTTVVLSAFTIIFSSGLSEKLFLDKSYVWVFWIYGGLLFFQIQNVLFNAILNGVGKIKAMTVITVATSVVTMLILVFLARKYGVKGVLISASIANVLIWVAAFYYMRTISLAPLTSSYTIDKGYTKQLMAFSTMSLVTGLLIPAIQFSIRSKLIYQINVHDAGIWQATMRLSDYYLNFIYSVLSVYYLPKLASISDRIELRKEILLGYARIIPAVIAITLLIWVLRFFIVNTFLSKEFFDMIKLLRFYLIGDVLKIASWILAFLMWAKALKKVYIITELAFATVNIGVNLWFINLYGVIGTGWAYIVVYTFYLLLMILVLGRHIKKTKLS